MCLTRFQRCDFLSRKRSPENFSAVRAVAQATMKCDTVRVEARQHLEKALKAPARPGRELADSGRRKEIQALLEKLNKDAK